MKKGDTVTIYNDPVTEKSSEGTAVLVKKNWTEPFYYDGRTMEEWQVRFNGEDGTFNRRILV